MGKIPKILLCLAIFISAVFLFNHPFSSLTETNFLKDTFIQNIESAEKINVKNAKQGFFEGNSLTIYNETARTFYAQDKVKLSYCVLEGDKTLYFDFYILSGESAKDIVLYLGKAAVAMNWFCDADLTCQFDFSLARYCDTILYARKTLLFEEEGGEENTILLKGAGDLILLEKISNGKIYGQVIDAQSLSYISLNAPFSSFNYTLKENISFTDWIPLFSGGVPFCGNFDGGGNTLNLSGSFSGNCGMFNCVENCVIKNLNLDVDFILSGGADLNCGALSALSLEGVYMENIKVKGNISAFDRGAVTGGLVGRATGQLCIDSCQSGINIGSLQNAGGFVGIFSPPQGYSAPLFMTDCIFEGKITAEGEGKNIGGFAGQIAYNISSANFINCTNNGAIELNSAAYSVGGIVGYCFNGYAAMTLSFENCVNNSSIVCPQGNRIGGLLGLARCLNIEILHCANYGEINCENISGTQNICGGLIGYIDNPCLSVKILNSLNYGCVKSFDYAAALAGSISAEGCQFVAVNCINAALVCCPLSQNNLLNNFAEEDAVLKGCVDLDAKVETLTFQNELKGVNCENHDAFKADYSCWKYFFESPLVFPHEIFIEFDLSLQSAEIYRYSYYFDAAVGEKVLRAEGAVVDAVIEGSFVSFAVQELSLYVIKVYSQGKEGFDYFFLEVKKLDCGFTLRLEKEGVLCAIFEESEETWLQNYWSNNFYSLYIEGLAEREKYAVEVIFGKTQLFSNAQGAYAIDAGQEGVIRVNIYYKNALVRSASLTFENDYQLPQDLATEENPLTVENAVQLIDYLTHTKGGKRQTGEILYFVITQNIYFDGNFSGITDFYGALDGGGYSLYLEEGENNAFITNLYGKIKNLNLENFNRQTERLYDALLCVNIYAGAEVENVSFKNCSLVATRNTLGLGVLAARVLGEGEVFIDSCSLYNCTVKSFANASVLIGTQGEKNILSLKNITVRDCFVEAQEENASLLLSYSLGNASINNCVFEGCSVKANNSASCAVACFKGGELFISQVYADNCIVNAQNCAAAIAASIQGQHANVSQVGVSSCVITESGTLFYERGGVGGIVGYCAASFLIEKCQVLQSVISSCASYGAAGGIAGVLHAAGEIEFCINSAAVTIYGVFGDAAGIAAYCQKDINIKNCANLGFIQNLKGRGGGMVSKVLGGLFLFNSYNLEKITAKKADALVAQVLGSLTLCNAFYYENCAPCFIENAFAFDENCALTKENETYTLLEALNSYGGNWEIKENFSFPLPKCLNADFADTAKKDFAVLLLKDSMTQICADITGDKIFQNFQAFYSGITAQETYIFEFLLSADYIKVYKEGGFLCTLYENIFEFTPQSGNDLYTFIFYYEGRVFFTLSAAFDLKFQYEIHNENDLLAFMQGKQKEGDFDSSFIDLQGKYIFCADIDFASCGGILWNPLGNERYPFSGTISGNGFKIENLKIEGGDYTGFLGLADDALIEELHLSNACVLGQSYVATLVGCAKNCVIKNCTVSGKVYGGGSYIGVILGYGDNKTRVIDCNAGTQRQVALLFASCEEGAYIGGVAGYAYNLYRCNSYVFITSQSARYVGGVVGAVGKNGVIEDCFAAGEVYYNALNAEDLPYVGYIAGYICEGAAITNCGYLLMVRFDCALEIENIEIFGAKEYSLSAHIPDGEGNAENRYIVILNDFCGGDNPFPYANYAGVTVRLKMKNNLYKFISSFDRQINSLKTYINIQCGNLTSYALKAPLILNDRLGALEVSCANDFEYAVWAINGGIPLTLRTAEGKEVYFSSALVRELSIKLMCDIDLTAPRYAHIKNGQVIFCGEEEEESFALNIKNGENDGEMLFDFYGLGVCAQAPYSGAILGEGHILTVKIDLPNSYAAGVITYAAKTQGGTCLKDLTLLGIIRGGKYAGAAGVLTSCRESSPPCFENVKIELSFKAQYCAGLIGAAYNCSLVNIKDCLINADFDCPAAAFLAANICGNDITLCFLGVNKDYTLLDCAFPQETITEGAVYRTVKVVYGLAQEEYIEIFTTSFDAQSITVNSLTIAGTTYDFEPFTLVFKEGNTLKKTFYLFILKGELTKIYDGNALVHLGRENYLGSWNIFKDTLCAQDVNAGENKTYDYSLLAIEKEPLIVCSGTFKVNISKAPVEVALKTNASLIYNACYQNYFALLTKENCPYSLRYFLIEEGVLTQLNHSPKDAARYRVKILLDDENFYISGRDYLDFEISPLAVFISFPQGYLLQKTYGADEPCWTTVLFDAPFEEGAEKIGVNFFRQSGESVGAYSVFAVSLNTNYIVNLKEAANFEIVKATPLLYFKNTQKVYNAKAENFTAFLEGVQGKKQPSGQTRYFYYTDENLTIPTTPLSSGAEKAGGVPVFAGVYYVKVIYLGDENYTCAYAVTEVQIAKDSPQFSPAQSTNIYAGQSVFDSELYGGGGSGAFSWVENILFNCAGEFSVLALFEPLDQVNYSCVQFKITVSVSWLTVTFNDGQKSESVNVLYGKNVDKDSIPISEKRGYSCCWEDVCTKNITDFLVVNALYTLLPPTLEIEGQSEVIYGEEVILNALAYHPLNNLSYVWYKAGCDLPVSNLHTLSLKEVSHSGAYTVTVSACDDDGNLSSVQKSVYVEIKPAQLKVTFSSYSGVYDGEYHGITVDAPCGSQVSYSFDEISWSALNPLFKDACAIKVYIKVCKENYDDFLAEGNIEIARRAVKITIEDKQGVYMAEFVPLTYTVTEGEIIEEDKSGVYLFREQGLDAGSYLICGRFDNENYFVEFTKGTYTITPLNLQRGEIAFSDSVKEYDGNALYLTVSGLPQTLSAHYFSDSLCTQVFSGAYDKGSYRIYAEIYCPSGNYLIEGSEFLVLNAKLTVMVAVDLRWEIEQDLVYCGGDLSNCVKVFFQDEREGVVSVPLTFIKEGKSCPFKDAGEYTVYATLGEFYTLKEGGQAVNVIVKKAKIDLNDIKFENLTVNFDNGVKRIEIVGELAQGVFVQYYCGGELFSGASREGEYTICARFSAGENYSSYEMTAKLTINRNAQLEEAFKQGVLKMGKVSLSRYQYLKELNAMYEEIIYKEGVIAAKQKLDIAVEEYNLLAQSAQLKEEEAQVVLEKTFLPLLNLFDSLIYAIKFSLLALACLQIVIGIKKR